jgi:hypothetical protein
MEIKVYCWSGFLRPVGWSLATNFAVILENVRSGLPGVPEPMTEMCVALIRCCSVLKGRNGFIPNIELLVVSL